MEVEVTVSKDEGPATHVLVASKGQFRKGKTGMAEMQFWGDWVVTGWKNDELDVVHMFKRLDGKPQMSWYELRQANGEEYDD